eukprot:TRINITY_DN6216_c0_g1_i1.p1 TRINITY_DN6216_c0_g1~~TRINITY_DN6216_c0_g1_i1.p1  ORF type:complete len:347 (-),score=49.22 TRINITY_DN6216_c0_g1_i1:468-1508(-)
MPSGSLVFRAVCGRFAAVYACFMLKRAVFKAAMRASILTLRTRVDGVTVGLLLSFLCYGNLLHRCGDVEKNPGPGPKEGVLRQTRLSSTGGTTRSTDKTGSSPGNSSDPTLKDVMEMLGNMNCKFVDMNSEFATMNTKFESMNNKFDQMSDDVKDVKEMFATLQGEIRNLKDEISELKCENESLKGENNKLNAKLEYVDKKVDDLEGRSKRNNIIIHGMPRIGNETWQDCEDSVREMITDKLEFSDNVEFDRVHRLSSNPNSPIVARCTFFKDKDRILRAKQKLKGSQIFVGEDFSFRVREMRRKLVPHLKAARNQNKKASMVYDHLVIEGKKYGLGSDENLVEIK